MSDYSQLSGELLVPILTYLDVPDLLKCERLSKRIYWIIQVNRHRLRKLRGRVVIHFGPGSITLCPPVDYEQFNAFFSISYGDFSSNYAVEVCERNVWGEFMLKTRLSASEALDFTFDRILTNFAVERAFFHNVEAEDFRRYVRAIGTLSGASLRQGLLNRDIKVPAEFFKSDDFAILKRFEIVTRKGFVVLDDVALLKQRNLVDLRIISATRVTIRGFLKLIEEWVRGERQFLSIEVGVEKTAETRTVKQVYRCLHRCIAACQDNEHLVAKPDGDSRALEVTEDNGSYWVIKVGDIWC